MKRILTVFICLAAVWGLHAQAVEHVRIYTDKDHYVTGEDLWIKVCATNSLSGEGTISKVAYVEISDSRQVHAQGKIALQNGTGWGRIKLPQTMHSGAYQLTAYTRFMRNQPVSTFLQKCIAVLNVNQSVDEDEIEFVVDSLMQHTADSPVYSSRSKVAIALPRVPDDARELSVSVVRKDCVLDDFSSLLPAKQTAESTSDARWIAECEGHIVTGKLLGISDGNMGARLAFMGKDIRVFEGQPQIDDTFLFYTTGVMNMQDVVLAALSREKTSCRLEIVSPFAGILPEKLPKLRIKGSEEMLVERGIGAQLYHLLPVDSVHNEGLLEQLHNFSPSISYNLDEYVRFTTVRETFIEFVQGVRVGKIGGETIIRLLQENVRNKALVLLDGIPIEDHETILNYDSRLLQYIHQYTGRFTFGGRLYYGIISFLSHKGTLPGLRLDENSQLFSYEFPQNRPVFVSPTYESDVQRKSRIPDFRHTLYWNPHITSTTDSISFYTSDMKGRYVVTLQGITSDGKVVKAQNEFDVK